MSTRRWEGFVEPRAAIPLLWKAKKELKTATRWDQVFSPDYPLNVSYALETTQAELARLVRPQQKETISWSEPNRAPKKLADLVPDNLIESKWEEQHSGSYRDALKVAAATNHDNPNRGLKVFRGIVRAIEAAYLIRYWGIESLRLPRVNILHKGLNQIASEVGLRGLTTEGFAEFLDDLCPCGLTDHKGAVRKLWKRSPKPRLSGR